MWNTLSFSLLLVYKNNNNSATDKYFFSSRHDSPQFTTFSTGSQMIHKTDPETKKHSQFSDVVHQGCYTVGQLNLTEPGPSWYLNRKQSLSSILQTCIALVHPRTSRKNNTALVYPDTSRENNHWAPYFKHLLPWSIPVPQEKIILPWSIPIPQEKTITELHTSNIYCPGPSRYLNRKQSLSSILQTCIALVHPSTSRENNTALVYPDTSRENNHWAPYFKHLLPWSLPIPEQKTIPELHTSNMYCPGPSQYLKRK